jgi:hypothetical protein
VAHQARSLARAHRDDTFAMFNLRGALTRKPANHIKPRRQAEVLRQEARALYDELDIEGAIKRLAAAEALARKGQVSRLGADLWLGLRLELGLRRWESEMPEGRQMVAQVLALAPTHELPPGVTLSETMTAEVEKLRHGPPGTQTLRFASPRPMLVTVNNQVACVAPCTVRGLPEGPIPWRANADGLFTEGGVANSSSSQTLVARPLPGFESLISLLRPLRTGAAKETRASLEAFAAKLPAPEIVWLVVGEEHVAVIRARVKPDPQMIHRSYVRGKPGNQAFEEDLLQALRDAVAQPNVGAPQTGPSLWKRLAGAITLPSFKLPKLGIPAFAKTRAFKVGALGSVGAAAVAGGIYLWAQSARSPSQTYDPVLGF